MNDLRNKMLIFGKIQNKAQPTDKFIRFSFAKRKLKNKNCILREKSK